MTPKRMVIYVRQLPHAVIHKPW